MKSVRSWNVRWVVGALLLMVVSPVFAADGMKMDEQSRKTLQAMSDYYAKAQSMSVSVSVSADIALAGQPARKSLANLQFQVKRPDKFLVKFDNEGQKGNASSDGKTVTAYVDEMNQYTQEPVDKQTVFQHPMLGLLLNGALLADDPMKALSEGISGATYVGSEKFAGVDCDHLKLTSDEMDLDVWIGSGDKPLVHKALVDQSRGLQAAGHKGSVKVTLEYKQWQLGQPIDDAVFTFAPPAGSKLVKQFGPGEPSELQGQPAPDFALSTLDGQTVKLSDLKGKVVILDFWATWCGPCRQAMPIIDKVAKQFAPKGVQLYAVNLRESPDQIKTFLQSQNMDVDVLLDRDGKIAMAYRAMGIPQTVIIGRDGVVRAVHVGLSPTLEKDLTTELEKVSAAK